MKTIIKFDRLFVVSESHNLYFDQKFSNKINIISGCNTSGKSTLIQSILFTFGINDVKDGLSEIIRYKPTFRLDFSITKSGVDKKYIIVRELGSIYLKEDGGNVFSFHGIDSDGRVEHVKLKEMLSQLFDFNMLLEQKGELKKASIECMFLPYYISQSVGWVYLRESFSNLGFYKDFKDTYLDYYLGIENSFDKEYFYKLTKERAQLQSKISSLSKYSTEPHFVVSKLLDEEFGDEAQKYIDGYINLVASLDEERDVYTSLCNKLSLTKNHVKILRRTKRNIKNQNYNNIDRCPACTQILPYSLEGLYGYYQNINDTDKLSEQINNKIQNIQSDINGSLAKIKKLEIDISSNYSYFLEKKSQNVSVNTWIDNKANIRLLSNIHEEIEEHTKRSDEIKGLIDGMGEEQSLFVERFNKEKDFKGIFKKYLNDMQLFNVTEPRYTDLYKINSFPFQGVELHKTVMSYHFALNSLIRETDNIHRLPFMLDAILKEDIDDRNFDLILSFVGRNLPTDTQSFISMSEYSEDNLLKDGKDINAFRRAKVKDIKNRYFPDDTNLFFIGDGKHERSFLSKPLDLNLDIFVDTCRLTE
ncbi:hypothetical protein ACRZK7_004565 [Klebsiella oxytoca]|uniref:Rad50/SbcC-type AAA domain-containing protein n=1 Tax=Klebsiella oxytoca TaxID=571 RepID=A0AAP2BIV4_KLEOX|nr:hypothetical protein [Klebsiella oxytoca]EHS91737.1 hypothetical protein HMPREF9689_03908 [Klebsiella oxytoca 10-5245]EJB5617097.1 hypothetical protein [Klebsiella oxytoca]EJZ8386147.1 hypothetical protein [Klebsiella oxytoca]EKW7111154.1 hypothetical protein [Klebsiella oxytoca]EKX1747794.1 hypothetical protein [Klebsiella oxytoca]